MSTSPAAATSTSTSDRIEKRVTLEAPVSRVWRALTDVEQFSTWFGIAFSAPFIPGTEVPGKFGNAKYAHFPFSIWIESMEAERFFSFRWHPYPLDEGVDYAAEPTTLITFTLEAIEGGTLLTIVEAGFDSIPESRRVKAFTMNTNGWNSQAENIRKFLAR